MKADGDDRPPSTVGARSPELVVRNLQRRHAVDRRGLQGFLGRVAAELDASRGDATLALVSDTRMRSLNRDFRGFDKPTDVLSFRAVPPYLGDIVISVETAARQARRRRCTLERELRLLVLHGFLHLLGYDHETDEGQMRRIEYRMRRKMRLTVPRARKSK